MFEVQFQMENWALSQVGVWMPLLDPGGRSEASEVGEARRNERSVCGGGEKKTRRALLEYNSFVSLFIFK